MKYIKKFRAWDREVGKMCGVSNLEFRGYPVMAETVELVYPSGYKKVKSLDDDIELMQYTGMKDMRGDDIYEDDIIELHHCEDCEGLLARVGWFWAGWWHFTEDETKGSMEDVVSKLTHYHESDTYKDLVDCEVVGNIYEDSLFE